MIKTATTVYYCTEQGQKFLPTTTIIEDNKDMREDLPALDDWYPKELTPIQCAT